ncbi:MAG: hypothetical protein LBG72_08075 [Spirochaetaceae bacterium]|nr:hypothetical protein [Spirochaetaceae bacterium]
MIHKNGVPAGLLRKNTSLLRFARLAGAGALVFGLALAGCDDGGGGGGSSNSGDGTALVAKWYGTQAAADADTAAGLQWEFKADGTFTMQGNPMTGYTYTASGGTITISASGQTVATANYSISGTVLTFSNPGGQLGSTLFATTTVYKKAGTSAGGGGTPAGGGNSSGGKLTITGLSAYNGKYIRANADLTPDYSESLNGGITISGGNAVIPLTLVKIITIPAASAWEKFGYNTIQTINNLAYQITGEWGNSLELDGNNATAEQALATLDQIIAYPGIDASTKQWAEQVKTQLVSRLNGEGTDATNEPYTGSHQNVSISVSIYSSENDYTAEVTKDITVSFSGGSATKAWTSTSASGNKPEHLPANASMQDAKDKLDEIIAYCDANPGNDTTKQWAEGVKSVINTTWSSQSANYITTINSAIDNLTGSSVPPPGGNPPAAAALIGTWTGSSNTTVTFTQNTVTSSLSGFGTQSYSVNGTRISIAGQEADFTVTATTLTFTNPNGVLTNNLAHYGPYTKQ